MTPKEVIQCLNRKGLLVGKPQPDRSMQYEWTKLGAERLGLKEVEE